MAWTTRARNSAKPGTSRVAKITSVGLFGGGSGEPPQPADGPGEAPEPQAPERGGDRAERLGAGEDGQGDVQALRGLAAG